MASSLHRAQARKTSGVPYVAHLLGVASLVLEEGGSEDMAIAALLHDAAEDQGGDAVLVEIAAAFGAEVARWVRQASDSFVLPKPAWEARKRHHLAQIPMADREARLIMLADKVHNARSILADHARVGPRYGSVSACLANVPCGTTKRCWRYLSAGSRRCSTTR